MNAQLIIARFLRDANLDGLADDIARGWTHVVAEAIDEQLSKLPESEMAAMAKAKSCRPENLAGVLADPVIKWLLENSTKCTCGTTFLHGSTNHAEHIRECLDYAYEEEAYPDEDLAPRGYRPRVFISIRNEASVRY